jgi:hypothetical protein
MDLERVLLGDAERWVICGGVLRVREREGE